MLKRYAVVVCSLAISFLCAQALFANDDNTNLIPNDNQVQIQSGMPSHNLNDMQSGNFFQDQIKQMQQMQQRMRQSMQKSFNDPFFKHASITPDSIAKFGRSSNYPQIKYFDKNKAYIAQFVVPGIDKSNIKIELKNNILNVSGNTEQSENKSDENNISSYSYTNQFSQSISVPNNVDTSKISSEYKNGILTITMPKTEEKESTGQIIPIN